MADTGGKTARVGGRTPNWVLQRRLCQSIIGKEGTPEYKEYVDSTRRQLLAGVLPPAIHQLILHYGYGKPVDEIEVTERITDTLSHLSEEQLRDRARRLSMARYILPDPSDIDVDTIEKPPVRELQTASRAPEGSALEPSSSSGETR